MAKVPRKDSNVPVGVQPANIIDPNRFRFTTAVPQAQAQLARSQAQLGQAMVQFGQVLGELRKRKIEMQDNLSVSNINDSMKDAEREYQKEIIGKPREQHATILQKHIGKARGFAVKQRMSTKTREFALGKIDSWADTQTDLQQITELESLQKDADIATAMAYEAALVGGTAQDIIEAEAAFVAQHGISLLPAELAVLKDKIEERAAKEMEVNAVNTVHAAMEAASDPITGGNFVIAKELAKNPLINEKTQTSLRTTIKVAEEAHKNKIDQARKDLINKTTSDTIREYFNEELSVATLNQRHEAGLIKDSEFKEMRKGLTETIPDNTDPFASGKIRRAMADFAMGAIDRAKADEIILFNYPKLNGTARANVVADLEDVEAKIIASAKSNAYSEGKGLMSQRFVGIQSEEDLIDLFRGIGLSDEEKRKINRTWTAEVANRDLYERAVDDRFVEMRQAEISDIQKFSRESLSILLQYQKRKRLSLEELEAEVRAEQKAIIAPPPKPALSDISKMSEQEVLVEKARIRELRKSN